MNRDNDTTSVNEGMNAGVARTLLSALLVSLGVALASCSLVPARVNGASGAADISGTAVAAPGANATDGAADRRPAIYALLGGWQHFAGRLLFPVDFQQGVPQGAAPGSIESGSALSPSVERYGTYRMVVKLPEQHSDVGVVLPAVGSAETAWIDGVKVASSGEPAATEDDEKPGAGGAVGYAGVAGDHAELVVQVSRFHDPGETGGRVLLGDRATIATYDAAIHGLKWSLIALLVLLMLAAGSHLVFRTSAEGSSAFPLFALLCFAGALRALLTHNIAGLPIPPIGTFPFSPVVARRLEEFSYLLLFPTAALAVSATFEARAWRRIASVFVVLGGIVAVGTPFLPVAWYRSIAGFGGALFALAMLPAAAAFMGLAPGAGARPARQNPWLGGAALAMFLSLAAETIAMLGILPIGSVAPVGVLLAGAAAAASELAETAGGAVRTRADAKDRLPIALTEELKKPIRGIVGLAESMLVSPGLPEDAVVSISLIAAAALRLSSAVSDVVDYERSRERSLVLELGPVAVDQVVERVTEISKPLMLARTTSVKNDLPHGLPLVFADRPRFERIVYNILSEALRRTSRGTIAVRAEAGVDEVRIVVETLAAAAADDAPAVGADPAASAPTASAPTASTDPSGNANHTPHGEAAARPRDAQFPIQLGDLGLRVAEYLISLHGGEVIAQSGPDAALFSFSFTIPRAPEAAEVREPIPEELIRVGGLESDTVEGEPSDAAEDRRGFRILIADDDFVSLQTMRNQLVAEGYRVVTTMNGEHALTVISEEPPDLVLIDAMVSGIGGYEVCRSIRRRYAANEMPVLILVDPEEMTGLMEGLTVGANDFITKPIVLDEFIVRVKTHLSLAKINSLYSRFVPVELLQVLGRENLIELKLGDQIQREMTILFVDIRAFTNLSERMTPQENFKFINSYLSRITPIIRENNGFIDKYIGDAILALYPGRPEDALRSAIRMIEYLHEYNGYRRNSGYRPINIGIGIHTGNLIVGIIGDNERMQGTVISDAVNLASRVQDVTKLYGANIIISQDTFVRLDNPTAYNFRFLGKVKVKGKDQTVSLFEVFDGELPERVALKSKTKQDFEDAILLFSQRKFAEAADAFQHIAAQNPDDRAASLFLNRAELFLKREKASWFLK